MAIQIPKKITPDSIKDAVVELRYASKYPFEILIGLIFNAFDDTYTYTFGQNSQNIKKINNISIEERAHFFYNSKIHVRLLPGKLVFNCNDDYIGWTSYRAEINKILEQLSNSKIIDKYKRVGIRYISTYPQEDLKNCTKLDFNFNCIDGAKAKFYSFNTNFIYNGYTVVINLGNNTPTIPEGAIEKLDFSSIKNNTVEIVADLVSVIDIDVFTDKVNDSNHINILNIADNVHLTGKEIFFSLIDENFLKKLNPEY